MNKFLDLGLTFILLSTAQMMRLKYKSKELWNVSTFGLPLLTA